MKEVLESLKTNLNFTKAQQEKSASKNRSPAPAYRVGDLVFLSTRNITKARPSKKLDVKFIGPCKISKVINSHAYKLDLPFENKTIYDVFHTSLLRLHLQTPYQNKSKLHSRQLVSMLKEMNFGQLIKYWTRNRRKEMDFVIWSSGEALRMKVILGSHYVTWSMLQLQ